MKFLLLRGQVPQDRDPKEIMHNSIDEEDDIYTQIVYNLNAEYTEVHYWGGERKVKYRDNFIIRWQPRLNPKFMPDVIWARGGFPEYIPVLNHFSHAFKIYYGAGKRWMPDNKVKYNLAIMDSEQQAVACRKKYPELQVIVWRKPAAENLFYLMPSKKKYDLCYISNDAQAKRKRMKWVYKTCPKKFKVLHLGTYKNIRPPKNITRRRVLREDMAKQMCKCKVGIVPYDSNDSEPRVIPEFLACGIPIVVCDDVYSTYIRKVPLDKFWEEVDYALKIFNTIDVKSYYDNNYAMKESVACLEKYLP